MVTPLSAAARVTNRRPPARTRAGRRGRRPDFDFDPPADGPALEDSFINEFQLVKQDSHAQLGEPDAFSFDEDADVAVPLPLETVLNDATLASSQWNFLVGANFSQYREQHQGMQFPWEQGIYADIFGDGHGLDFPVCAGLAEKEGVVSEVQTHELLTNSMGDLPVDAKFIGVVSATKDLDYFEEKHQKLELACAQWLELLSISWRGFGVGAVISESLHADPSGAGTTEISKAIFGIKSPSTILQRASSFRQFVRWYDVSGCGVTTMSDPFPIKESAVWSNCMYLRSQHMTASSGYTVPASFLETVRFAKFSVDLRGADILGSRRLLGFAAIEKKLKGPTRQAPGLELEHVRRLHQILMSGANDIDRLFSHLHLWAC